MDLKAVHYAILALSVVGMVANSLATALPAYAAACHGVAGVCASLAGTLGVLSPSAVPVPAPAPAAPEAKVAP